jgi:hypothetical protein
MGRYNSTSFPSPAAIIRRHRGKLEVRHRAYLALPLLATMRRSLQAPECADLTIGLQWLPDRATTGRRISRGRHRVMPTLPTLPLLPASATMEQALAQFESKRRSAPT